MSQARSCRPETHERWREEAGQPCTLNKVENPSSCLPLSTLSEPPVFYARPLSPPRPSLVCLRTDPPSPCFADKLWANGGSLTDTRGSDQVLAGSTSPGLSGGSAVGGSPGFSGRVARSASVVSLLPASEQRTRRVILDFSNVVSG